MAEPGTEIFEHLRRQRSRTGDEQPHESADLARGLLGQFEQADVDGRYAEEERRAEIEERFGGLR